MLSLRNIIYTIIKGIAKRRGCSRRFTFPKAQYTYRPSFYLSRIPSPVRTHSNSLPYTRDHAAGTARGAVIFYIGGACPGGPPGASAPTDKPFPPANPALRIPHSAFRITRIGMYKPLPIYCGAAANDFSLRRLFRISCYAVMATGSVMPTASRISATSETGTISIFSLTSWATSLRS